MIRISAPALDHLEGIATPPGRVLRLQPRPNRRLGLTFGPPRPDDQVVEHEGRRVVHIPHRLSEAFDGAVLGVRDADGDVRLVVLPADAPPIPSVPTAMPRGARRPG